ncbi:MAG: NifB/NifX family molybdenum-iron cluster-binding protein [Clostridia bacterium]|nr:NifB/NifX family molybdenum-iron cluster-binding protein [Clostridia bacterium]
MKIAFPVDTRSAGACIYKSFGRAPAFLVYDTQTQKSLFVDNSAASSQGGAGIKAAQLVLDQQTDAVIAPQCGQNAADVLLAAGVRIYLSEGCSVGDNIKAHTEGLLKELSDIHAGYHGHGVK